MVAIGHSYEAVEQKKLIKRDSTKEISDCVYRGLMNTK